MTVWSSVWPELCVGVGLWLWLWAPANDRSAAAARMAAVKIIFGKRFKRPPVRVLTSRAKRTSGHRPGGHIILGVKHHATLAGLALAFGAQIFEIAQRQMQHAALA